MQVLTPTERQILLSALDVYRRVKGAEGKLAVGKLKLEERQPVQAKYATLAARTAELHKRLSTEA